jgi:hypothetical protein
MPAEQGSAIASSAPATQEATLIQDQGQTNLAPLRRSSDSEFDVIAALSGASKLVERVVVRQLQRDIEEGADFSFPEDPALSALEQLIASFQSGGSTVAISPEIEKLLNAQDERTNLINNLLVVHDMDRLPSFLRLRRHVEQYLIRAAMQGSLSPAEALAFLKIGQTEIDSISSRVRNGANPVKDIDDLLKRADFVNKASDLELIEKFKSTTPQGREILRKIGHKIAKAARNDAN